MNLSIWKNYLNLFRDSFRKLVFVMVVAAGQSVLFLLIAYYIRYSFDNVIPSGDSLRLVIISLILIILFGINIGITLWLRYITRKITTQAIYELRNELLLKCISFPRSYYSEADISKLHTNIVQYTQRLDVMNNSIVTGSLPAIVIVVGMIGVLMYMNLSLFAVMVFTILPLIFVNRKAKNRIQEQVIIYNIALENLSKGILFTLQNMDLIKNQSAEKFEIKNQRNKNDEMRQRSFYLVWADSIYAAITNGIISVTGVIVLMVGGIAVISQKMSLGELLSFYVVIAFMRGYLGVILKSIPLVIEGNELISSLYEILETKDSLPYTGQKHISFHGKITLDGVSFGYTKKPLLNNANLKIEPGSIVVLMGKNGVGKSTIANLIAGHYRPNIGCLFADDHAYDDLDMFNFRKHLGIVQQDPIIFSGTIIENIIYGQPKTDLTEVEKVCKIATADEFIQKLPDGLNTITGESGIKLSGGQRQKIAIARTLLRQPQLLILDEPTNHLDDFSRRQLINNLKGLDYKPAILIITHEIEIARLANIIYTLEDNGQLSLVPDIALDH